MITSSTLISETTAKQVPEREISLPEFAEPSEGLINSLLNFSKSFEVKTSGVIDRIEIVKS